MNASAQTRIKICGITRLEDAVVVADSGADALGLVFTEQSARQVSIPTAAQIAARVAGRLMRVGLFLDPDPSHVAEVLARVSLDVLQFHGAEARELCSAFGLPYMKAHRVAGPLDMAALSQAYPDACCHLLDTYVAGQPGGTGQQFDRRFWPGQSQLKLVLAGGLNADNVAAAIAETAPYGVDVSGGVESDRKGIKDPERIRQFVAAVRGRNTVKR